MGVSLLTVVLGILIGSILYGPAGAFLGVPVAAATQVIFNDTLRPALEEETPKDRSLRPNWRALANPTPGLSRVRRPKPSSVREARDRATTLS